MENTIIHFEEVEANKQDRIFYIKKINSKDNFSRSVYMWKVTESEVLHITGHSIELEDHDDIFDQVSFIKNTLCEESWGCDGSEEITREEFDAHVIDTVTKLNKLISA